MEKIIIITGGGGFIGSCLINKLSEMYDIIVVDDMGNNNKWRNLQNKKFLDLWTSDEFYGKLNNTISNCDAIIHLGAITSTIEKDTNLLMESNYRASKKIYKFCSRENVHLIYASSASVYGKALEGFSEESRKVPENPYGFSKMLFDQWVQTQQKLSQCVGLRFFNVYGPNEYHKGIMASVILHFYEQIMQKGSVDIFKSYQYGIPHGDAMRDFVYVKDVVDVIAFFLSHPQSSGIYNVGTSIPRTYNDLAKVLFHEMGKPIDISYIEMIPEIRDSYQYVTKSDISKLRQAGYKKEFITLEEGIHDYVQNYLISGKYY